MVITGALCLHLLDKWLRVSCPSHAALRTIGLRYAACVATPQLVRRGRTAPDLDINIQAVGESSYALGVQGLTDLGDTAAVNDADLHDELDRLIVIGLQHLRPDLYFLHAAVLSWHGRRFLIAGHSGHGKLTTAWGLLHHGGKFVSDELAPIDLRTGVVHPFLRALCLKRDPPPAYPLPDTALRVGQVVHVPTAALLSPPARTSAKVAGLVFVHHDSRREHPQLRRLSAAECASRLYANALNALAHDARGLDVAVALAAQWPAVAMDSGDLTASCELLGRWMDSVASME